MKTELKTPVSIFVRVSSDRQDFNRQVSDLQKIADKNNYKVVSIITEKITGSKTNDERKGIIELMEGAKSGLFKKVLCSEISRVGRNTIETLKTVDELNKLKVSLYLQDLNIETLNEDGEVNVQTEMLTYMMALYSKNEKRNLILRIRSGIEEAKKNGVHCGRYSGTEDTTTFLSKYPKIIEGLKRGLSVRECVKLYDTSLGTVAKIRKLILPELQMGA